MAGAISAAVDALAPLFAANSFLVGEVTDDVLPWDGAAGFVQFSFGTVNPGVVTEIVFATQALVLLSFASRLIFVGSLVCALEQDLFRCVGPPESLAGGATWLAIADVISDLTKDLCGLSDNWFLWFCDAACD